MTGILDQQVPHMGTQSRFVLPDSHFLLGDLPIKGTCLEFMSTVYTPATALYDFH